VTSLAREQTRGDKLLHNLRAMTPLVSILIPAYNSEAWIADTITSALAQTWPRTEIIIVDDGSRDETLRIARQFESAKVLVISQPNQGAAAARNNALQKSQGDYIQWLDADDLMGPNKIATQMEGAMRCSSKRTLFSGTWGYFLFRPQKARWSESSLNCDLTPVEWLLRKMEQRAFMQTSTWLVSRELTGAAGPWDARLTADDDGEYFSRVVLASDAVRFVPDARIFYRIAGSNSLSYLGTNKKKLESQFLSMLLQFRHFRAREDSQRVRQACTKFLQNSLIYFYPEHPDLVKRCEELAASLGGRLGTPQLPRKYAWMQRLFGWPAAKGSQLHYNRFKLSLQRALDRALFSLENRTSRNNAWQGIGKSTAREISANG
jgi:glycosyltransferase involved in cell wall biosynthesis